MCFSHNIKFVMGVKRGLLYDREPHGARVFENRALRKINRYRYLDNNTTYISNDVY